MVSLQILAQESANFSKSLGGLLIPFVIVIIAVAFVVVVYTMATRYKKIPPNAVGIFYGRKYKYTDADGKTAYRGFRVVAGGGALLYPIVEHLQVMSTAAQQSEIDETKIPNKDNVQINVRGVASIKISTAPEDVHNAAMAFLGKTDQQILEFVRNILQGHLRSIIGKLSIQEILRERDTFNRKVVDESAEELHRLGIQVITLVIQEVTDQYGYIDALGKQAVAEAVRDANIKVAEADSATKKKVSDAAREASVVQAQNAVAVAEAERDRDVKKAQFKVVADSELAKADKALAIATALQEQILLVKEAERDAAQREAQVLVAQKEAMRKEQELVATVIRPAEAAKEKAIIEAQAAQQQSVINAEAAKSVAILQAEATKQRAVLEADGARSAQIAQGEGEASKTKAVLVAQAEGDAAKKKALLVAEAEGTKQLLMAQAEGQAAMKGKVLLAEAEGTLKLAEALGQMSTDARLILVLDRLPALFDRGGDAAAKVAAAIFEPLGHAMQGIDEVRIIDMGGGSNGNGKADGLERFGNTIPNLVLNFFTQLKARGINPGPALEKLGIDAKGLDEILGSITTPPAASTGLSPIVPTPAKPVPTTPAKA